MDSKTKRILSMSFNVTAHVHTISLLINFFAPQRGFGDNESHHLSRCICELLNPFSYAFVWQCGVPLMCELLNSVLCCLDNLPSNVPVPFDIRASGPELLFTTQTFMAHMLKSHLNSLGFTKRICIESENLI